MAAGYCYCLGIKSNNFFLKDNKKAFILWLNVPKVTAYACYRFLFPDRSLDAIQEMMLYGFSDLQLAELYAPYNYALKGVNEFYMEYENDMYDFCYIKGKNLVRRGRVLSWQSDKIIDLSEIRKELQKLNHDIRNLLLG